MKTVTKEMIKSYGLKKLQIDFMGYPFIYITDLSFHHLIIPRTFCSEYNLGRGVLSWNGAILTRDTAHSYLHVIEKYDLDRFYAITSEMIDENIKGFIDIYNIAKINDILLSFELEYLDKCTNRGHKIIKDEYLGRVLTKK